MNFLEDLTFEILKSQAPYRTNFYNLEETPDHLCITIKEEWLDDYDGSGFCFWIDKDTRKIMKLIVSGPYEYLPITIEGISTKRVKVIYHSEDLSKFTTIRDFLDQIKEKRQHFLLKLRDFYKLIEGENLSEYLSPYKYTFETLLDLYFRCYDRIDTFQKLISFFYRLIYYIDHSTLDNKEDEAYEKLETYTPPSLDLQKIRDAIFEYRTLRDGLIIGLSNKYDLLENCFYYANSSSQSSSRIISKILKDYSKQETI